MNALDRDAVIELFAELGERLRARGFEASIYVFGGAAMLMHGLRTSSTEDIDSFFGRNENVREIAREMTLELGLAEHWMSESGAAFIPSPNMDVEATGQNYGGLSVRVASIELLLAHKLTAWRPKDLNDIDSLLRANSIRGSEEAVNIVAKYYSEESVPTVDFDQIKHDVQARLELY